MLEIEKNEKLFIKWKFFPINIQAHNYISNLSLNCDKFELLQDLFVRYTGLSHDLTEQIECKLLSYPYFQLTFLYSQQLILFPIL